MKQQKEFTVSEQSQSQEDSSKSNLIKYEEVNGTPFTLVEKDNEVLITIGNQVCDPNVFKDKAEAKKYINKKSWLLIATTAMILAEKILEQKLNKE